MSRGAPGENDAYRSGWYLRVRENGKEVTRYAGLTREIAIEFANKLARQADRRDLLGEAPACELTFEAFAKEYLQNAERIQTKATYVSRRRMVEAILVPYFRGRTLAEIRSPDVQRLLASRIGVVATTRNRLLTGLSSMFRRAMELGYVQANPAREVKRLKETRVPIPLVDLDDQDRLIEALAEPSRGFYLTLLETGMRLGEILRLEWRDVDVATGKIVVRTTKAKRPRVLTMTEKLHALLASKWMARTRPLKGPDLVFPGTVGLDGNLDWRYRRALPAAVRSLDLPYIRIHDLRHLCAINLVRAGVDLPTVQAVLGHTSLISTLRYAEYSDGSASVRAAETLNRLRAEREAKRRQAAGTQA